MRKNETISNMINEAALSRGYILKKSNGVSCTYLNKETGDEVDILSPELLNQKTAAMSIRKFQVEPSSVNFDID